jgi:RNA polymerase sigma-B factor
MAPFAHAPHAPLRVRGAEHALFHRFVREREPEIRNALVERYMPLARHLARRYPGGGEHEDVLQVASFALVKAVDRFDPSRGIAFTSYATPTILGEIKRYFRDHGWTVRVPRELQERSLRLDRERERLTAQQGRAPTPGELADELDISVDEIMDVLSSDTAHRPVPLERPALDPDEPATTVVATTDHGFELAEDAVCVQSLLARLTAQERVIVLLRFHGDLLQREIAELVGISQMQVSRILGRAIAQLQELVED